MTIPLVHVPLPGIQNYDSYVSYPIYSIHSHILLFFFFNLSIPDIFCLKASLRTSGQALQKNFTTYIRYNDKIPYNDNLNEMIPYLKMRQISRDI